MLFLMIASLDIYAKRLTVTKDTVVTYTLEENRKIAIIFKEGEYYRSLSKNLESIIHVKDSIIDNQNYSIYTLTNKSNMQASSIKRLETLNSDIVKDLKRYMRKSKNLICISAASISLNILLLLLL